MCPLGDLSVYKKLILIRLLAIYFGKVPCVARWAVNKVFLLTLRVHIYYEGVTSQQRNQFHSRSQYLGKLNLCPQTIISPIWLPNKLNYLFFFKRGEMCCRIDSPLISWSVGRAEAFKVNHPRSASSLNIIPFSLQLPPHPPPSPSLQKVALGTRLKELSHNSAAEFPIFQLMS